MKFSHLTLSLLLVLTLPPFAQAHFGMLIPDSNHVDQKNKEQQLILGFGHPQEMTGMKMERPKMFGVVLDNMKTELTKSLSSHSLMDHQAWKTTYQFESPGVYTFYFEPHPYWEPVEDVHIIHYTKTVVAAYGGDTGWEAPVGLPVEIVPLTRPFGNYQGNLFSGTVLVNGKPAAGLPVEVEYYNEKNTLSPPTDYHITQVVTTDPNGVFHFATTNAGWYGFSALTSADYSLPAPDGKAKEVELGGVMWVYFSPSDTQ